MTSHAARAMTVLALAGAASGCGNAAPATTAATQPRTAATAPGRAPRSARVSIAGFDYHPRRLTVRAGAAVRWTNHDQTNHTVTFDRGSQQGPGNIDVGRTASFRFTRPGSYAYHCDFHPNMHGVVVVRS